MKTEEKLSVLAQLYALHDRYMEAQPVTCRKACASCCTRNVIMTSLEGLYILDHLSAAESNRMVGCLKRDQAQNRFQPQISINRLAENCRQGVDLPEEEVSPDWTPCPVLTERTCPIYPVRPFGCRCLSSTVDCAETGYAQMTPLTMTVNQVFQQYIEHLDADGTTGNLLDVLLHLEADEARQRYRQTGLCPGKDLVSNHPLTCLMVPPEHRTEMQPLLADIRKIRA